MAEARREGQAGIQLTNGQDAPEQRIDVAGSLLPASCWAEVTSARERFTRSSSRAPIVAQLISTAGVRPRRLIRIGAQMMQD